jgi:N-acetylglucosamine-6-phosphate deacetylase
MTALRGTVVTPVATLSDGVVVIDGDRIAAVLPADHYTGPAPEQVPVILPGLVDVHCHGGGGGSFTSGDPEQVAIASEHHRACGTTTLVGSTVSDSPEVLLTVVSTLADACEQGLLDAIHLEGPFLAGTRCGAQDPRHLRDPDPALADELLAAGRGHVRMMTIAPELPGAALLAATLRGHGVVPAVGHTNASAAQVAAFLSAGGHVTHLFNGMAPMHHREPGAAGGALESPATLEVIADGAHLADETVRWLMATAGPGRLVFVTDAMAAAGMPDGHWTLGPQDVVTREGVARIAGDGSLAGGTTRLSDVLRRQVQGGIPLHDATTAAATTPARALGFATRGRIEIGTRADLLITSADLDIVRVMRAGRWVP